MGVFALTSSASPLMLCNGNGTQKSMLGREPAEQFSPLTRESFKSEGKGGADGDAQPSLQPNYSLHTHTLTQFTVPRSRPMLSRLCLCRIIVP